MINFIIYENNKIWQQFYIDCFLKIIKKTNKKYTVIKFKDYSTETLKQIDKLVGKKIYFLDFYLPSTTGIEIAYEIRRKNDWFSPIILFIANKNTRINYETKILRLNLYTKKEAEESIKTALRINKEQESFNFIFDNKYYQIPYEQILYFEKSLNNNYTKIITTNKAYKIHETITNLTKKFKNIPFLFQTHQSCIINLHNVKKINFTENIIYFTSQKINLLSREKKRDLKNIIVKNIS